MKHVATLSVVLALAVILLPWQICDCSDDGPHLLPLWVSADCHPVDSPAPSDDSGEPEPACGDLFQFEGMAAAAAEDLPAPSKGNAHAHPSMLMAVCTEILPAREAALLACMPPGDQHPDSALRLATRLLL